MTSTYSKVFSQSSSIHSTICREQITSTSQKLLVVLLEKCPDRWNPETHHVRTHRKISYCHLPKVLVLFFFFRIRRRLCFQPWCFQSMQARAAPQKVGPLGPGPGMVLKAWGWGLGLRWELRWGGRWMREERGNSHEVWTQGQVQPPRNNLQLSCWTGADRWHCHFYTASIWAFSSLPVSISCVYLSNHLFCLSSK